MVAWSADVVAEVRGPQSRRRPGVDPPAEEAGPAPKEKPPAPTAGIPSDALLCTSIAHGSAVAHERSVDREAKATTGIGTHVRSASSFVSSAVEVKVVLDQ